MLNVNAGLNAAVPADWLLKLNSSVCHVLAAPVNMASVSQDFVGSVLSSTFNFIEIPVCGLHTLTFILLSVAVNGIAFAKLVCTVPANAVIDAPAHNSAVFDFTTLPTLLVARVGSVTTVASSAPPKPTKP